MLICVFIFLGCMVSVSCRAWGVLLITQPHSFLYTAEALINTLRIRSATKLHIYTDKKYHSNFGKFFFSLDGKQTLSSKVPIYTWCKHFEF